MARKQHTYHYIYKTVCLITEKFYIGMHSCSNLEDGYMGSGKRLRYSIRKHGIENHTKEILEFFNNRESLAKREAEIVNEQFLQDPLCMNLKTGGSGGLQSKENCIKRMQGGVKAWLKFLNDNPGYRLILAERRSAQNKIMHAAGLMKIPDWTGKKHKEESKIKIGYTNSIKQLGTNNSQYGSCWITNGLENKKIRKDDTIPSGWHLGRTIQK
jgi:hypothetical protein